MSQKAAEAKKTAVKAAPVRKAVKATPAEPAARVPVSGKKVIPPKNEPVITNKKPVTAIADPPSAAAEDDSEAEAFEAQTT